MHDSHLAILSMMHVIVAKLRDLGPPSDDLDVGDDPRLDARRDRGAVSIETVLWYAAAAVSVAVVAAIIWSQIRTTASTSVNTPSAP
ncbi:MAG: hypothetical protein ACE37B_13015 [Ilumatobacter sp.]|jgi:hypothetical protein|uniref:hypothetical protein n=1 Tax=Ilumatobacter sp. TaxID=1967498 RepID=UPI00391A99BD